MRKGLLLFALLVGFSTFASCGNVIILNPGCKQFDSSGKCAACSNRFYKDLEGICQPVSNNCRTYKPQNGACTSCYDGFSIVQDTCLPKSEIDDLLGIYGALANCNQIADDGTCKKCSTGYYFDIQKNCKQIPTTCARFDSNIGQCTGCYQGYALNSDKECVVSTQTVSDPGCSKFDAGKCIKCSVGFYFDANRKCRVIPPTCQNFDTVNYRCNGCYPGFALDSSFNCIASAPVSLDPGCAKFDNGVCSRCSFGFYFNKDRVCRIVPATCSNFDTNREVCLSCYPGYALNNDKVCVESAAGPTDLGCSRFEAGKCVKCSFGFYFNKDRVCRIIPPTCGNFDTAKEICLACYPGYILDKSNSCIQSTQTANLDPGCNSFDSNGKCTKCSFGYYFGKNNNCKAVPPTCSKFDTSKQICLNCYPGFAVDATGNCVETFNQVGDLGCAKFDNGVCTRCSMGFYFDAKKQCKPVPATCSNFDTVKLQCLACYPGYTLDSTKTCIVSPDAAVVSDLGCSKFINGKCTECSNGFYFNSVGKCQQIPPTCSNFDTMIAVCKACYSGYELNAKNQCILSSKDGVSDLNCRQWKNNVCVSCAIGAFFDINGKCQVSDPLCKRFVSSTKRCEQCYPGFTLDSVKNVCFETPAANIDPNCKTIRNGECQQCSFRYFKSPVDGKCKQIDSSCRLYSSTSGECTGCYDGYKLNSVAKKCQLDQNVAVSDINCAEWKNGKCTKCAYGAYFGSNGVCANVDPLCMTWNDVNGECKSCYPSFEISFGKCIPSKKQVLDQNCNKFGIKGQCQQCSKGFYFNAASVCTQVDPLCSTFDSKFARCLTCYAGYKVSTAGKCVEDTQTLSDLNCAQFKNSACVRCSTGFYFDSAKLCRAINPQCRYFDQQQLKCTACYPGYILFNSDCVVSTKDNLCAQWKQAICLRCVPRAYFNDQGGCDQVSSYCKDYNMFDGACESCYGGFQLKNGNCTRQTQSNGCVQYSKDNVCLTCEKRKYLDRGVCNKIDDLCDEFNFIKKSCNRCYKGYTLDDNGKCIVAEVKQDSQISNCFTYNLKGGCVECYDRFYLKNNTCNQVNVFCKKYNPNSGDCTDCYTGFKLDQNKCIRK